MKAKTNRENRISIRCDLWTHQLLDKAAAYTHVSVSEFVLAHARASAEQIVQSHESITLTEPDFQAFLAALDAPAEPNAALDRAFNAHSAVTNLKQDGVRGLPEEGSQALVSTSKTRLTPQCC